MRLVRIDPTRALRLVAKYIPKRAIAHAAKSAPWALIVHASEYATDGVVTTAAKAAPDAAVHNAKKIFSRMAPEDIREVILKVPALALAHARPWIAEDLLARVSLLAKNPPPLAAYTRPAQKFQINIAAVAYGIGIRKADPTILDDFLARYHACGCNAAKTAKALPFPCNRRTIYTWIGTKALRDTAVLGTQGRATVIGAALKRGDLGPLKQIISECDGRTSTIATIAGVTYATAYRWLVFAGYIEPKTREEK